MKRITALIILFSLIFNFSFICRAQDTTTYPSFISPSAYTFSGKMGDVEQLRIQTYIWGQVKKPGMYIVPDDTDLVTLLSLAGGPTEDAKLSKVRIVRYDIETEEREVIWVNVKKYIDTADKSLIPILKPGDTVVIAATVFYGMERVASFISKFATVLSMYNIYLSIRNE